MLKDVEKYQLIRNPSAANLPHGCNVYLAEEIKKHVKVPVATLGGLSDPAQMEEILASGKADIIYMGRALLADPFLPRKVVESRDNEIVTCLRCFTCMAERAATATRRCTLNSAAFSRVSALCRSSTRCSS